MYSPSTSSTVSCSRAAATRPRPSFGLLTLCVAAGMGFGALNEVVEFIAVLCIPDPNVGGDENTGWDLVANFVGSVIAALALRFRAP